MPIDLRHPNIVECYEALDDAGAIALVMEFLDGQSLARIRQRRHVVTAVPTSIHLRVLANVLDALHYLHEAKTDLVPDGIIHGDVRPDNVFVTFDGRTKLLHAGIENAEATTGIIREKLSYMSPERAKGAPIDRRSDLFSVGVMLWEAATGLRFWQDWPDVAIFRRLCAEGDSTPGRMGAHQRPRGVRRSHPSDLGESGRSVRVGGRDEGGPR